MGANNNWVVVGHLGRDPELSYVGDNNTAMAKGSIAVDDYAKKQRIVHWFNYTVFGKRAESFAEHAKKGSSVCLSGKARREKWEKDGQKRSDVSMLVDDWSFAGKKADGKPDPSGGPTDPQAPSDDQIPF